MLLQMSGHERTRPTTASRRWKRRRAVPPDVVLLDIGLPGMNGYEVAGTSAKRRGARAMVLVALTGWGQEEDRRQSEEAGFDAHLVKPAIMMC